MILVDTSVWVDHLGSRGGDAGLAALLRRGGAATHPYVLGELACGRLTDRDEVLAALSRLPLVTQAGHAEVLTMVDSHRLWGSGIGWIDAHLLASSAIAGARLWTRDRSLARAARALGVAFDARAAGR